jgi:prophage endopeptidase
LAGLAKPGKNAQNPVMNRSEFILATAVILFVAFALGWFTYWILHRFARISGGDMGEVDRLAQSLHEAEELRDQALLYLEQREGELSNQIAQTEAELRAAMEGLRDARTEAEEMRKYIERMHSND